MSRSETKLRDSNIRCRSSAISEPPFRGRRSASVDNRIKQTMVAHRSRNSSEERKSGSSLSRWSGSRKSSVSQSDNRIPSKDPRPLNDSAYQKRKATDLLMFLDDGNFNYKLTVGKLMQPTKKDFEVVFQYLVNFLDPGYEVKRIEEEAPIVLRRLMYPYIPNKSAFLYFARTSVPAIMGILIFLMDLVKCIVQIDRTLFFRSAEIERPEEHAVLLEYIFDVYISRQDGEEEEQAVFTKIINSRITVDEDEVKRKNKELKESLEKLEHEHKQMESLQNRCKERDFDIKKYEEYFCRMEVHKGKREESCLKLQQELDSKKSELSDLQSILKRKQSLYDAQGFDGKKQVVFYEEQKKELADKLQQKRTALKVVQDECWEVEMQYAQTHAKGVSVCDDFNKCYSEVSDKVSSLVAPLQRQENLIGIQQMPALHMAQKGSSDLKAALEETRTQLATTGVFFQRLLSHKSRTLQELLVKKSELSVSIKVASAQESQQERDIMCKDNQILDEIKAHDLQCEQRLKLLEKLQLEHSQEESTCIPLKEELAKEHDKKATIQKKLDILMHQRQEFLELSTKYIEELHELEKESGKEIESACEEAFKHISNHRI